MRVETVVALFVNAAGFLLLGSIATVAVTVLFP